MTSEAVQELDERTAVPSSPVNRVAGPRTPISPRPESGTTAATLPASAAGPDALAAGGPVWENRYVHLLLAADVGVALGAGAVAFGTRFGDDITRYNRSYLLLSLLLPAVFVTALGLCRAYERRYLFVGVEEYQRVMRAGTGLIAALALASYAVDGRLARGYVVVALPLTTAACLVVRFLMRTHLHRARRYGICMRRVIVVGHDLAVLALSHQLRRERYHGLQVVGCCLPPGHSGQVGLPVFGSFEDVGQAVRIAGVDTVIALSCPELDGAALRRLGWQLAREDIDLMVASSLVDVAGTRTTIRPVDGLPLLHVEHPRLTGGARALKEVCDRLGAALLLVASAPLLGLLAAAVRWRSPGPVLFRQVRVGKDGREFTMYKFRTMHADAESRLAEITDLNEYDGVMFKVRDDPRVTPSGRWLRRFSLDEIPQLINVVRGQMSLVGPRPPLPGEVARYAADVWRRLAVKPGMTGLWQVSGRSDLPWEEAVRLDLRYVENWSLSLDLVILLRTLTAVCRASGAY